MDIRVTDAEREQAAQALRMAAGVGALDIDELDERLTAAYSARTKTQLEALTTDLPVQSEKPPSATEPSRWWLWAAFSLPAFAWLHALVITKAPKFGIYAGFYLVPIVLALASDTDSEASAPAWLVSVYGGFWLVGLVHALMTRDEVERRRARLASSS